MLHPKPKLIMIRPRRQSEEFVQVFCDLLGELVDVLYAPVIEIEALDFTDQTAEAFVFTSINGLEIYAKGSAQRGDAYCVGRSVGARATELGFHVANCFATAQDLNGNAPRDALYVRGVQVAHELNYRNQVIVYRQQEINLSKDELAELSDGAIVPIFSPQSAKNLARQLGDSKTNLCFVGISDAALAPLQGISCQSVRAIQNPTRNEMMRVLAEFCKPALN